MKVVVELSDVNEEVLNRLLQGLEKMPSVERVRTLRPAFVIMRFDDELLDSAYEGVIRPLLEEFGYDPRRVDEIQDSGKISDQILSSIRDSELIVADLTGERPNCYYEVGYAHALGKEMILTIKKGEQIHFDLSHHRFIIWFTEASLRKQLRKRLGTPSRRHTSTTT